MTSAALSHFPASLLIAAKQAMIDGATGSQTANDTTISGDIDYFIKKGIAGVFRELAQQQEYLVMAFSRAGDNTNANACASKQEQYLAWANDIDQDNPVPQ